MNTKLFFRLSLASFLSLFFFGNDLVASKYAVSNISDELKENAVAVVRDYNEVFTISTPTRALYQVSQVITILDKRGEGLMDLYVSHDSFRRLRRVSGTIYDEHGKKIRDLKKSEFNERSGASGFTLFAETRVTSTDLYSSRFPVTVEFSYEMEFRDAFFPPRWYPVPGLEVSVQSASYTINTPRNIEIRTKVFNTDLPKEVIHNLHNENTDNWYIRNYKAVKNESSMPPFQSLVPYGYVAFNDFAYGGYSGNMSTWEDFGKWIHSLGDGRQNLPPATVAQVRELVKDLDHPFEKAQAIYEFVQGKTRYVNIVLGIGGLQTMSATDVDRNGYGDCKALSNYTQALLAEVGVESFYTIINSGSNLREIALDFPSQQFNHVIVSVPFEGDTLWLETTSNFIPAGFIGTSNASRYALMVKPDGGVIVRTPDFTRENSSSIRIIDATLERNGSIKVNSTRTNTGSTYEDLLGVFLQGEENKRRHYLSSLDVNSPSIQSISLTNNKSRDPNIVEDVEFSVSNYASRAGNRLMLDALVLGKPGNNPPLNLRRDHDIYLRDTAIRKTQVNWTLPQGYSVSHVPSNVVEDNDFGFFEVAYGVDGNTLSVTFEYYLKEGQHSPERYREFAEFFRKRYQAARSQVVLVAN